MWKDILKIRRPVFQITHVGSRQADLARLREEAKTPAYIADEIITVTNSEEYDKELEGYSDVYDGYLPYSLEEIKQGKLSQARLDRQLGEHKGKEIKYINKNSGYIPFFVKK